MGPDFVIQRVIAAEGGKWAEFVEGDSTKVAGAKPDEGLPAVKAPVVQHLEKDVHDPTSAEILATICLFNKQKQMCHDQVRFIFSHPKNNNLQTVEKAKELRAVALETWKGLEAQMAQKIKDDALITEFGEGHRVHITLLAAQNLPMFDQFNAFDPYCTVMMRPVHVATPKLDGRKTECIHCYNKTAFGKESCEEHKSDWIASAQTPQWNKRITVVLDAGAAEAVFAIYSSGSRGKAHELIGWCHVPIHSCLYKKAVQRSYFLVRGDGTPLKVKVFDEQSHTPTQRQAVLHVRWKMILPKLAVAAGDNCFVPIGASLKGLTGKYNKRFVGGASYYGSWQDGMPHGKGKYVSEDGTEYEGEWSWSKMHGTGTFTYSNGDVYTGAWRDNFRHGIGTCVARNGDVYAGEWRFGYQHGRGRHETQDGVVYDGEWKENRAHGCGLVTEPDGDKWDDKDKDLHLLPGMLLCIRGGSESSRLLAGIFHEGKLLCRNDSRPPTPPNISAETEHCVEEVPTAWVGMHSISSLIHEQAASKNYVRAPYIPCESWNAVRVYRGDEARYDEDPRLLHRGFFQRNEHALAATPQVQLAIRRKETEIDERLLRRETEKEKIKAQRAREEEDRLKAKAAGGRAKSVACTLS